MTRSTLGGVAGALFAIGVAGGGCGSTAGAGSDGGGGDVPGSLEINYTFDHGTEGWALDRFLPVPTNLGVGVPDGGSPPTLGFADADGYPSAGALELRVTFTAPDQYVLAIAEFSQPGLDLSGKTIHAMVRLAAGSLGDGRVLLGAVSGPSNIVAETPPLGAASLTLGKWVPLTMDLGTTTAAGFDSSKIGVIGVRVVASAASFDAGTLDGGSFASAGETVIEIDTVTD